MEANPSTSTGKENEKRRKVWRGKEKPIRKEEDKQSRKIVGETRKLMGEASITTIEGNELSSLCSLKF